MKMNLRSIRFIGRSTNWSDYTKVTPEENNDTELPYEASDRGTQVEQTLANLNGDQLLVNLLMGLDNRDKIVLLYQVLREAGYNLEYEDCAKTLSLSKSRYVILVKNVKKKCMKVLKSQKIV